MDSMENVVQDYNDDDDDHSVAYLPSSSTIYIPDTTHPPAVTI